MKYHHNSCPGVSLFSYTTHSLFHRSVKPLPAAVGGFGFKPSARHPRLLRLLAGTRVDNVAFVRAVNHRLEEVFVLSAAPPVGAGQRLAAAHDHLSGLSGSVQVTRCTEQQPCAETPYHPVLPVTVAEDGEASSLSEFGHLFQHFVVYGLGDDGSWRVRGAHREVSVHGA